jgi:hypothetical protein
MSASVEMNYAEEIAALKARVAALEAAKPKAEAKPEAAKKEVKAKAPASEKPKAKKAEKTEVSLPSDEDGVPEASAYRVAEADIDHSKCIARVLPSSAGYVDKRWSKHISREKQCCKKVEDGKDLCESCAANEEAYAEEASKKAGWKGRIGEEPLEWLHMLGTKWAEGAKLTFNGSGASESASVAESEESEKSEKPKAKGGRKPAADKEEKEAKKAAEKAEKEAKKAAEKAEKEAKKEAEKAEKEAKKEAKKATKAKPEAKPAAKKEAKKEAKVAKVVEPTAVEFELKLIGDTVYALKNGNVYEWDADAEVRGDCVGRLTGDDDDPSIDTDAAEVV